MDNRAQGPAYGTISLIRHGQSSCTSQPWIDGRQYKEWLSAYDDRSILSGQIPLEESLESVRTGDFLYTSHLARAIDSAALLGPGKSFTQEALFREAAIPAPFIFKGLKLSTNLWNACMRLCWLLGYSGDIEPYRAAKKRAEQSALQLMEAASRGNIVLVGHGFFNHMIGKELRKHGWHTARRQRSVHWACTTYRLV
ncbi:histidine phosphatase family protein [Bacillus sp. 1P06AnD]|uniref:histidine phosphatase family protein n=1 Tax=Bacillus sp. 1P06AnD TaxID=3132208 RepID=UPI0039A256BC